MMRKKFLGLCAMALTCVLALGAGCGGDPNPDPDEGEIVTPPSETGITFEPRVRKTDGQLYTEGKLTYPASLWREPAWEYDSSLDPTQPGTEGVRAFFLDSPIRYGGKKTKVMGYLGFPEGASEGNKVPGIVLVHGGLGTAYPDWVKLWNERGYAAVAVDTEGGQSAPDCLMGNGKHAERNKYENGAIDPEFTAGPTNTGFLIESMDRIEDCWMYHATSSVILANSLLCADSRVDAERVGITGISWGGIITNILAGYDDRYAFAMPVYGSVGLDGSSGQFNSYPNALSREVWDTTEPTAGSTMPILWLNSNRDFAFALDATEKCYRAARNGYLSVISNLTHGQGQGAGPGELAVFADAVVGRGNEIVKVTEAPTAQSHRLTYRPGKDAAVHKIVLCYTTDDRPRSDSVWREIPVDLPESGYAVEFEVPRTAKYFYVNVVYNLNLVSSTPLVKAGTV